VADTKTVWILGDGAHEVAKVDDEMKAMGIEKPALTMLVHRMLGEPAGVDYVSCRFKEAVGRLQEFPGKGNGLQKRLKLCLARARKMNYDAVVLVQDRDRKSVNEAFKPLEDVREAVSPLGSSPGCALGLAIETFDAWMICDPEAIEHAGGDKNQHHPSPENLDKTERTDQHPKEWAANAFGGKSGLHIPYAKVAKVICLDTLRKACSGGFAPFERELAAHVAPRVQS
jgi:hypothetical protein